MHKETNNIDGYAVCVNFDMSTYFCILDKKSRFCDGICIVLQMTKNDIPILPERD